jgi:hypothetical protein
MLSAMPQGRDGKASTGLGLLLHHSAEEISNPSCKYLPPLGAIKGEPGLTAKAEFTNKFNHVTHTHHSSKLVHSQSSNQRSVHHTKPRSGT